MLGYLGPAGTFSHQAALDCAQKNEGTVEFKTINAAIEAVEENAVDRAIVPIENSIEGAVNITLDMLAFDVNLYITGEYIMRVSQNLLTLPGAKAENLKTIISHPQAIGQCAKILNSKYSYASVQYSDSTAAAAKAVLASDGTVACIGSRAGAKLYGLDIAEADCGDDKSNSTRFVIIEKKASAVVTDCDKTSIAFTLDNKPGSLYEALKLFYDSGINMTKIESRPIKTQLGTYVFFIDIDGNIDDATIYFALDNIRRHTSFYKFLGSYKRADI